MILFTFTQDQPQVGSFAYNQLLKGMLKDSVPAIGVSQLADLGDITFLDSRSAAEYSVSRIHHAVRVGYEDFNVEKVESYDREKIIVVYCSIGVRSEKIVEQMQTMGFRNVYNLYGGIFEWVNQQFPIYDAEGHPTKLIHGYSPMWGIWLQRGEKVFTTDNK